MRRLLTVGYEGTTPPVLAALLREAGVARVVDVRAIANSRRPGFSKRALAATLAESGIGYTHLRALGTPPEGRAAVREGRPARMREIFGAHLAGVEPQAALAGLTADAAAGTLCLLCLEADHTRCHRSLVADAVRERDPAVVVEHLHPKLMS